MIVFLDKHRFLRLTASVSLFLQSSDINMAGPLEEAAKQVTAEFDVSKDDLAKLVAEFLREMGGRIPKYETL